MLKPLTLAVIEPREIAARAVVDMCPIVITETMTREYSRTCVLHIELLTGMGCGKTKNDGPEYRQRIFCKYAQLFPEHCTSCFVLAVCLCFWNARNARIAEEGCALG